MDRLKYSSISGKNDSSELYSEIMNLTKKNRSLREENTYLKEQIEWFKKHLFGPKSDKIIKDLGTDQPDLDGLDIPNEQPEIEQSPVKPHLRKKRKKKGTGDTFIEYPDNLPVSREVLDIPEDRKIDPETGESLVFLRNEISRKLAMKQAEFYIIEYVRPVYVKKSSPDAGVMMAFLPDYPVEKCPADISVINHVLISKFADHLPLYRIQEQFARRKVRISRQTLSNWVLKTGEALEPLYDLMRELVLSGNSIFVDETPVKLYVRGLGKCHQAYMWVYAGGGGADPPYRVYEFCLNRKYENVISTLGHFKGHMHSDQYGAYEKIASSKDVSWVPCMAHIRRKFIDVGYGDPELKKKILRNMKYLFMFERTAWNRSPEERLRIRREKEEPIIDGMINDVEKRLIHAPYYLPRSKFRTALEYFMRAKPYLKNYLSNPDARLDNNVAERALRPLVIGRKNWLFLGSGKSGKSTATLLSLIQTCRALDINPAEYMLDVMTRIMSHPHKKLDELLPDRWAALRAETSRND